MPVVNDVANTATSAIGDAVSGIGNFFGIGGDAASTAADAATTGAEAGADVAQAGSDVGGLINQLADTSGASGAIPGVTASGAEQGVQALTGAPPVASTPAPGGGGVGPSAAGIAPFGSDSVPTQAINGKPDVPTDNSFIDRAGKFLQKNTWLLPALGLGASGVKQFAGGVPNEAALKDIAQRLNASGSSLLNSFNGPLPAGVEAGLKQQLDQQIASIRSKYASLGESGSSSEMQDINAATANFELQKFQIQEQLVQLGGQQLGAAGADLAGIANASNANDAALTKAFGDFLVSAGITGAKSNNV